MKETHRSFAPFGRDGDAVSIGEFLIENANGVVTGSGDLEIRRDKPGLAKAQALAAAANAMVEALKAVPDLPEDAEDVEAPPRFATNPLTG